ncbi:MAG: lysophospholipid acyltransferase family protein [Actinomycetota bacterium]
MQDLPYRVVVRMARSIAKLGGWVPEVEGAGNVPAEGSAILASNHISYLDFVFAAWSPMFDRGRFVRFMAKKEVFDSKATGVVMRMMKHISVDRKNDPARALDLAIAALERGEVIGTFPEGSINRSLVPGRGKTGAVRMAQATGAPIIPIAIWGAHRIFQRKPKKRLIRNVRVFIAVGPPFPVAPDEDPRLATDRLMTTLGDMVDQLRHKDPLETTS